MAYERCPKCNRTYVQLFNGPKPCSCPSSVKAEVTAQKWAQRLQEAEQLLKTKKEELRAAREAVQEARSMAKKAEYQLKAEQSKAQGGKPKGFWIVNA